MNAQGSSSNLIALGLAFSSVALFLGPAGCMTATPRILARERTFDASEYASYEVRGTAELSGQAIAKTRWGGVIYGAEDSVYLFPATAYTDEWWQRTLVEGKYLADPDPRSLAFMHTTAADEQGRFRFRSLPAGEYYVVCIITWEPEGTDSPLQVVNLGTRVHLRPNETAIVVLEPLSRHRALIDPPPPRWEDR